MSTSRDTTPKLIVRRFETLQDYSTTFEKMKAFSQQRSAQDADELWLLQHHSVLTQGLTGKAEHIVLQSDIPIVHTDRGGQVTWHGPGQLVAYLLFDLNRLNWHVRDLVNFTEQMLIWILAHYNIEAYAKAEAPGVYVDQRKIGSLGFKIRRGCSYHGLALNFDCQLDGFQTINPCGYPGLEMVRLSDLIDPAPNFIQLCQLAIDYIHQKTIYTEIDCEVMKNTCVDAKII